VTVILCPSWATWAGERVECMLAKGHEMHEPRHAAWVGQGRTRKLATWREDGERATTLEPPSEPPS
jgi:hypothetical protein